MEMTTTHRSLADEREAKRAERQAALQKRRSSSSDTWRGYSDKVGRPRENKADREKREEGRQQLQTQGGQIASEISKRTVRAQEEAIPGKKVMQAKLT